MRQGLIAVAPAIAMIVIAQVALAQPNAPSSAPGSDGASTAAIVLEIKRLEAEGFAVRSGGRAADPNAQSTVFPRTLFIASTGWIYDGAQMAELGKNSNARGPAPKVIRSGVSDPRVIVYNNDTAISTFISETYYEVPNPQQVAEQQGTLTEDPAAMARAAAVEGRYPREPVAANPHRARTSHIWVRDGGQWKIALAQATEIGERTHPGR